MTRHDPRFCVLCLSGGHAPDEPQYALWLVEDLDRDHESCDRVVDLEDLVTWA